MKYLLVFIPISYVLCVLFRCYLLAHAFHYLEPTFPNTHAFDFEDVMKMTQILDHKKELVGEKSAGASVQNFLLTIILAAFGIHTI